MAFSWYLEKSVRNLERERREGGTLTPHYIQLSHTPAVRSRCRPDGPGTPSECNAEEAAMVSRYLLLSRNSR
jgi:hypothetical protein